MPTNEIRTRIQLKYDTLSNWSSSIFVPLEGEVCIAEIPSQTSNSGLTPPAVGIKVGDGTHTFSQLPWIQAVAGDVYAWAKNSTKPVYEGSEITATRKDSADLTDTSKWTYPSIEAWLQSLTNDLNGLSGGAGSISTQIVNTLANLDVDNDATSTLAHHITGFSPAKTLSALTETDGYIDATFQDIAITESQVANLTTDLANKAPLASPALTGTPTAPTASAGTNSTQIATTAFVKNAVDTATAGLTGAMHYKGTVSANPTATAPTGTFIAGDVVTYNNSEFVYDGTNWRELGDESSYALKTTTVTGANGLTGGGALSSNQVISHATRPAANSTANATFGTASGKYVKQVKVDAYGHTFGVEEGDIITYTLTQDTNNGHIITFTPSSGSPTSITIPDNNTTYTFAEGTTNGAFSVTPSGGTAQSVSVHGLKTIATSGSIYDVVEHSTTNTGNVDYLLFNCGSATVLVD